MDKQKDITNKISTLKRKILTLEWDKQRNQIHFARSKQLDEYKKQLQSLQTQLQGKEQGAAAPSSLILQTT